VFAIWIGFACTLYTKVLKIYSSKIAAPLIITASLLAAPVLMASQNWDDHDL
jgi:hypothetical protein